MDSDTSNPHLLMYLLFLVIILKLMLLTEHATVQTFQFCCFDGSTCPLPEQADLKERYSVSELLADLAGCRATRVLLFVDQSYSGVLSKRLRSSQKHHNVVLIQHQSHQTQRLFPGWDDNSWSSISAATCLLDHLQKASFHAFLYFLFLWYSTDLILNWYCYFQVDGMSRLLEPWAGLLNVTLAGAPCNATPPLTDSELQREYQGCQNLPTALWYQKHGRTN